MIANLGALRGVAAWMVVIHHMRDPLAVVWPPAGDILFFAAGVDLFFVLSGVVMVVSTQDREVRPGAFIGRRFARVAPLYWLATLAVAALLIAGFRPAGVADWTTSDLVASMLFWPDIRADGFPGPLLAVGWTLTYEAGFYALFAAALFAGRAAAAVVLAMLAALSVAGAFIPDGAPFALRVWTAPLLLEFAAGVAIGRWWTGRGPDADHVALRYRAVAAAAAALLLGVAGAGWLAEAARDGDLITPGSAGAAWRVLCFGAPAALLIWAALTAERVGFTASSRRAARMGAASFAIYLIHLPVLQIAEKAAGAPGVIAAPAFIAVLALALHDHVERPATRALRALFERRGQQRPKSSSSRMMSSSSR